MTATDGTRPTPPRKRTIADLRERARRGEGLVMVTAYDATFARLVDAVDVDAILVGDSVGNVVAGFDTTIPVTLDQMIYHGAAVRRGAPGACLIVDMPFLTYQAGTRQAMRNCGRVMQETNAQGVKLEGGSPEIAKAIRGVVSLGVPVMGHLGFTPQSVHALGGFRVQGREDDAHTRFVDDARRLEDAGAFALVLELVPADLAGRVTESIGIPTIGIGAGPQCSGQVLVLYDLLGLSDRFNPKFLKRYADLANTVREAVRMFGDEVRAHTYPNTAHSF
jgi:3-methyl-2-oxobutanoate hydroxymethyltransferase